MIMSVVCDTVNLINYDPTKYHYEVPEHGVEEAGVAGLRGPRHQLHPRPVPEVQPERRAQPRPAHQPHRDH